MLECFISVIVIVFEILYYSLFMKSVKRDGKLYKYLITFSVLTIIGMFLDLSKAINYLLLIIVILLLMKYVGKIRTYLFDIFPIIVMLFVKIFIEGITSMILFNGNNKIFVTLIFTFLKFIFLCISFKFSNKIYMKLKETWYNNNFFIRYITSVLLIVYTIISILVLI